MRMKQGEEGGRREDKRTSRTGEKLVWSDCGSGSSVVGEIHPAALPARRPAVLASLTWFGRGQASDNDGREEHQNLAVCKGQKLTTNLGARRGRESGVGGTNQ